MWTTSDHPRARLCLSLLALVAACVGLTPDPALAQTGYRGNLDLGLSARVVSDGCYAGDTCTIGLAITNFGPDSFDGALRLRGRFQGNVRATLTSIGPSGWSCNQAARDTVCTYRAGGIRPGRTLILETAYDLPTGLPVDDLSYCASIEWDGYGGGEPSVADIQRALAARGYNPGPADGVPGFGTRNAIQQFQSDNGLEVTGWPTREFNERLFGGVGYAGDIGPGNDRSCARVDDSGPAAPYDRGSEQPPSEDVAPPADEDAQSTDDDAGERQAEPDAVEQAPLPRIHTPAPAPDREEAQPDPARPDHDKAMSSFHETYRSGLHDKVLSQPGGDAAPNAVPQTPIHGKQTSEFHRKQLSTQHDKATSGAVVESQPLAPITDGEAGDDNGWKAEFHQKYKSVQHKKDTSTLQEVHTKAISRVVHSKARSVITNPQFQGGQSQ